MSEEENGYDGEVGRTDRGEEEKGNSGEPEAKADPYYGTARSDAEPRGDAWAEGRNRGS